MIVACYDLALYCDVHREHRDGMAGGQPDAEFTGHDRRDAFRAARKAGWVINTRSRPHTCRCPTCDAQKLTSVSTGDSNG